jgi:trimeric autotransporter adhesin
MKTPSTRNSIDRSPLRCGLLLVGLVLAFSVFGLSPQARALCEEGCDSPTGNTFLGFNALIANTAGNHNAAVGFDALTSNTMGSFNTATGYGALLDNTTGNSNTAVGYQALQYNTTGANNTASGDSALSFNTTGDSNTAVGHQALQYNSTGTDNTAYGVDALYDNYNGDRNVATGVGALAGNSSGIDNTATGYHALNANDADYNTATGYQALESNTSGSNNTAHGLDSLYTNSTGSNNTANGAQALFSNVGGNANTAEGSLALHQNTSGINNTALGADALYGNTTGSTNIGIGFAAGFSLTTGSNNIDIGNLGVAGESNTIRVGTAGTHTATFIAGIKGVVINGGPVAISSTGQLGQRPSSARFKEAIEPMDQASEVIFALRPVTFRYKKELDPKATPQFGLIAEDVGKIAPELVVFDERNKPFTVRYEEVNAMLLNEFLKEHREVERQAKINQNQEATIAQVKSALERQQKDLQRTVIEERKEIQALAAALKEQAAQIQKVARSRKIETGLPASEIADN